MAHHHKLRQTDRLIASAMVTAADGHAEREAAKVMINAACEAARDDTISITLGADKGYGAQEFVDACRDTCAIPHVGRNTSGRRSAVPAAIARKAGKRKPAEAGLSESVIHVARPGGGSRSFKLRCLIFRKIDTASPFRGQSGRRQKLYTQRVASLSPLRRSARRSLTQPQASPKNKCPCRRLN